jgi:hypothetical protein
LEEEKLDFLKNDKLTREIKISVSNNKHKGTLSIYFFEKKKEKVKNKND